MTDCEQGQHGCISMKAQTEFFWLACISKPLFVLLVQLFHPPLVFLQGPCKERKKEKKKDKRGKKELLKKIHLQVTSFHIAPVFGHHQDLTTKQTAEQLMLLQHV